MNELPLWYLLRARSTGYCNLQVSLSHKKNNSCTPCVPIFILLVIRLERFPFTKKFLKFQLGGKWNTSFWFVPLEISWNKWNSWKGSPIFLVETSQWKICVPFTDLLSLSPVPCLLRSLKWPGLPRMGLVTNGMRFSQMEIPNRKFPNFFVNGKRPSCCPIRSVILLMISKSNSHCAVVWFCYHSYDYSLNRTPLSPIIITNSTKKKKQYTKL